MVITFVVSLWACALVCFVLAVLLPFFPRPADRPPLPGRLNLVALGLAFAALAHLWPGR